MTLADRLADAQTAYHDLQTGRSARVVVDQNGERVEYTPANAARLAAYIADLKRLVENSSLGPLKVFL
jgi:hypothetical protein